MAQAVEGYILKEHYEHKTTSVQATARYEAPKWVVVLSRKLSMPGPGRKEIVPGKTYTFGLAIHENFAGHRFHHVSFERTLVLDSGEADLVAVKQ